MARPIFWQIDLRRSQVSGLVMMVALPNGVMSGGSPSGPLAIRVALPSSTGPIGQGIDRDGAPAQQLHSISKWRLEIDIGREVLAQDDLHDRTVGRVDDREEP